MQITVPAAFYKIMGKKEILERIRQAVRSDLGSRLVNGSFWSLAGTVGGRGIVLLAFVGVARMVGKNDYGELGIIRSTINMFLVFASLGIGGTAAKYIAQYRNNSRKQTGEIYALSHYFSVLVGGVATIALLIFSSDIATYSLHAPHLTQQLKLAVPVLFFAAVNGAQSGTLSGFEDFKILAVNTFVSGLIQGICLIIGTYWYGISGAIVALGLGNLVLYFMNWKSIHKRLKQCAIVYRLKEISKKTVKILWKYSLPSALSSLVVIPVLWWTKTFLIKHTSFDEMAVFDVAEQWYAMVLFIPSTLSQILLPILSNTLEEGTYRQYVKLIKINLGINILVSLGIALVISLLSHFILSLYGKEFTSVSPLIVMMFVSVMVSAAQVVGQVIASKGEMWIACGFNLMWSVWLIGFAVLFVNHNLGALGLALAILCSYTLHFIGQGIYLLRILRLSPLIQK